MTDISLENELKQERAIFELGNNVIMATYLMPNGMVVTYNLLGDQVRFLQGKYTPELYAELKQYSDEYTVFHGF